VWVVHNYLSNENIKPEDLSPLEEWLITQVEIRDREIRKDLEA